MGITFDTFKEESFASSLEICFRCLECWGRVFCFLTKYGIWHAWFTWRRIFCFLYLGMFCLRHLKGLGRLFYFLIEYGIWHAWFTWGRIFYFLHWGCLVWDTRSVEEECSTSLLSMVFDMLNPQREGSQDAWTTRDYFDMLDPIGFFFSHQCRKKEKSLGIQWWLKRTS